MGLRAKKGNYYDELARAKRRSDFLINEVLYIQLGELDLRKIKLAEDNGSFKCNFMKVFTERLNDYMELDSNIKVDEWRVFNVSK